MSLHPHIPRTPRTGTQVKYGSAVVGGASHPATFVRVYDLCGPTYPGEYDADANLYLLHYPGLLFLFPVPAQHAQHCQMRSGELPLEFPDGTTPVAARICIYAGPAGVCPSSCALLRLSHLAVHELLGFWECNYLDMRYTQYCCDFSGTCA